MAAFFISRPLFYVKRLFGGGPPDSVSAPTKESVTWQRTPDLPSTLEEARQQYGESVIPTGGTPEIW